jgi:toxin ParE1/3/4
MNSFSVSRAARADLKNIAAYTQNTWGAEQRKTYLKGLDTAFHFLAKNPHGGTRCDYIVSGLRKHRHESHTIFYENRPDCIFIVRVLHKSMDAESKFISP